MLPEKQKSGTAATNQVSCCKDKQRESALHGRPPHGFFWPTPFLSSYVSFHCVCSVQSAFCCLICDVFKQQVGLEDS